MVRVLSICLLMCSCGTSSSPEATDEPASSTPTPQPQPGTTPPTTPGTSIDTATIPSTDSGTDTGSDTAGVTTDTGEPTTTGGVDCTNLPALPVTYTTLNWVSSAEDFTFAPDGTMMAVQGGHLQSTVWGGQQTLLVPSLGDVRGTRMLADGRMALAHIQTGSILIVDPTTGSQVAHAGMTNPNGIAIGDDGQVYVATTGRIVRLDPDTGAQEVVADVPGRSFDGLSFSPDYSRLYFNEEVGRIHWVDFDSQGVPGPVQDGPSIPIGAFSLLDGMAVDACGNLYTTEMGSTVWRVATDGSVDKVIEVSGVAILPALNFGSGVGGWEADKLYVMDFLGKMYEVDIGVQGKAEPHLP